MSPTDPDSAGLATLARLKAEGHHVTLFGHLISFNAVLTKLPVYLAVCGAQYDDIWDGFGFPDVDEVVTRADK